MKNLKRKKNLVMETMTKEKPLKKLNARHRERRRRLEVIRAKYYYS
jgi:hypothetical protein